MEAMNCKACRIEIEEAEANEPLSASARAHAETCLPCGAFRVERQALGQLIGSLETVTAPPDFDFRLRARLSAAGREERRRFAWPRLAHGMSALALAASLALLIGAGVIFRQVGFNRQPATQPNGTVTNIVKPVRVVVDPPTSPSAVTPIEELATHHGDKAPLNLVSASRRGRGGELFREPKLNVAGNTSASAATDPGITSIDFDVHNPSPSVYPTGIYNPAVDPNPPIIVPVRALAQPAKFLLDEGRGVAAHIFSLRNVTFGSEKLVEGNEPTLVTDASDIW
jgi:hypothetical protein